MIGAVITLVIICLMLETYRSVLATLHYFESKNTNKILCMDSTQAYLSSIRTKKTNKSPLPPRRNGVPMQDTIKQAMDEPTNDVDNGINLLSMDPDEAYKAVMETMGVTE